MIHYRQAPWILILCLIDGRNLEGQVGVSWRHPEQGVLILTNFNTEGCVRSIQLYVGTWNTFHILLKTWESQGNLCRDGKFQDLPDTH